MAITQAHDWIDILKALLTPTIGAIGAWIAYSQYKSNELKRRYELFDRRLKIYDSTVLFIQDCIAGLPEPNKSTFEKIDGFMSVMVSAKFLFGDDVYSFLDDLLDKAGELHNARNGCYQEQGENGEPLYSGGDACEEMLKIQRWFALNQYERCTTLFSNYMDLEHSRECDLRSILQAIYTKLFNCVGSLFK